MTQLPFGTVAPASRRVVAYIIDALIAAGLGIVLTIILVVIAVTAGPDGMLGVIAVGAPLMSLVLVAWFVVYTVMQGGKGSIGMRAQGLRLAREADGAPLGFGKALLRNIIFGLAASIVVGYFTPLFDGSGRFQGWHDKVAGSLMLDARAGGGAVAAPVTQAIPVPPRPPAPEGAPPIPGLATPPRPPVAPVSPALDETVRGVDEARRPGAAAPLIPAPQMPIPQMPDVPHKPAPMVHPAAPTTNADALIAFVPGITQDTPPERRTPAPPAAPEEPSDVGDIEDTRISIPGHRLIFTWDDGTRVTVSRRTLFGRNPAPEEGAVAVPVRDETLSLSKTHFEVAAEASGGWVMDRHSTNGTVIVRDGERITCTPGEQVRIRLGDAIEIGDRIVTVGGYA